MPDCDLSLLLDGGQEWTFVVDFEGEDAVLVGSREGGGEGGAVAICGRGERRRRWKGESMLNSSCRASFWGTVKGTNEFCRTGQLRLRIPDFLVSRDSTAGPGNAPHRSLSGRSQG